MSEESKVLCEECRRCVDCADSSHHWMENDDWDEFEDREPTDEEMENHPSFACKHCDAVGEYCPRCDGSGEAQWIEGGFHSILRVAECPDCRGEGVILINQPDEPLSQRDQELIAEGWEILKASQPQPPASEGRSE